MTYKELMSVLFPLLGLWVVTVTVTVLAFGCSAPPNKTVTDPITNGLEFHAFEHNGHQYFRIRSWARSDHFAVVHDPDCEKCKPQ